MGKNTLRMLLIILLSAVCLAGAVSAKTPSSEGAELYFVSPKNGEFVTSPVTVRFGLKGMGVAPAGVEKAKTGHHHLIINADLPPMNLPIPKDDQHKHFGGGQTETVIELTPGKHTLQLLLGDHNHLPHDPPLKSERITIYVKK